MHKQWLGCHSSNFLAGRGGFVPQAIVLHSSGLSVSDFGARCAKANSHNSAHYAIDGSGEVNQFIEEKDTAFHCGLVVNATWSGLQMGKNPNFYTIAVEFEKANSKSGNIDARYDAAAELLIEIAQRWTISLDATHVVLHSEIRAGAACPGASVDRSRLLQSVAEMRTRPAPDLGTQEVRVLRQANVREGPRSSARVVRVAQQNTCERIISLEENGERIKGNPCWYRTEDGCYLWAGATDVPSPATSTAAPLVSVAMPSRPAQPAVCGISEVDALLTQGAAPAIGPEAQPAVVQVIQDLLTGHGIAGLPTLISSTYGTWTAKTSSAVQTAQKQFSTTVSGVVDKVTLEQLIQRPAADARVSRAYLTLVLSLPFDGLHKILSLVAQMEGAGKFAAMNRNTDRAGLSFGLIQWAQKPGRLYEILSAFSASSRTDFVNIFGDGDAAVADALLAHTHRANGGVDPATGATVSPAFNLIEEPWLSRFRQAGCSPVFQQTQIQVALTAFSKSCASIRRVAPDLRSERAIGFSLDVANQFGDAGFQRIYTAVHKPGMEEMQLLEAIADETVARIGDSFKTGVRTRRDQFLETHFLSDQPVALS